MEDVLTALVDPIRRLLLERLLADNGQALRKLGEGIAISRQGLAKHLAVLERAGLVVAKRAGRQKLHFIRTAPLEALADGWLARFRPGAMVAKSEVVRSRPTEPKPAPRRRKRIDTRPNHAKKSQHDPFETERRVAEQMVRIRRSGRVMRPVADAS
ncbi:MAG: ArsR/SmtB family transcription factor [Gemmatimonadales bacterium]